MMATGALLYLFSFIVFGGRRGWCGDQAAQVPALPRGMACRTTILKERIFQGVLPMGPLAPCRGSTMTSYMSWYSILEFVFYHDKLYGQLPYVTNTNHSCAGAAAASVASRVWAPDAGTFASACISGQSAVAGIRDVCLFQLRSCRPWCFQQARSHVPLVLARHGTAISFLEALFKT